MKIIANVIWFVFGGWLAALLWLVLGLLACITVIGIPVGLQFFKFAQLVIWPFGNEVSINFDKHPILNIIWIIFIGWEMAMGYLVIGALFCITIIGIPFGLQWFKLTKLALLPFGSEVKQV